MGEPDCTICPRCGGSRDYIGCGCGSLADSYEARQPAHDIPPAVLVAAMGAFHSFHPDDRDDEAVAEAIRAADAARATLPPTAAELRAWAGRMRLLPEIMGLGLTSQARMVAPTLTIWADAIDSPKEKP